MLRLLRHRMNWACDDCFVQLQETPPDATMWFVYAPCDDSECSCRSMRLDMCKRDFLDMWDWVDTHLGPALRAPQTWEPCAMCESGYVCPTCAPGAQCRGCGDCGRALCRFCRHCVFSLDTYSSTSPLCRECACAALGAGQKLYEQLEGTRVMHERIARTSDAERAHILAQYALRMHAATTAPPPTRQHVTTYAFVSTDTPEGADA